ncbi:YfiT family bacillithiol transferase [Urechidicola croceus]|uniref:Metal-dependent hydrolase n=1 Tax=Urechidicola croceus TaxID=1850246 RepID=A0A1D8P5Q8_9FLAO|nr:putative metal-dependent hydrolase [Urechidicola croceus]AOW19903.1 metal-dependent hydrolase [Urechidicola croceus]
MTLEKLKYPIGQSNIPEIITNEHIKNWIEIIDKHPDQLIELVSNLTDEQLDKPYRPDGWTSRQVVHHLGDSHTNSYIRFKWTLTETSPIIKAYDEVKWAELPDTKHAPIAHSLTYLKSLHQKWVYLLKTLTSSDLKKYFIHPATGNKVTLEKNIGIYAWHCQHHFEHINQLLIREGWKQ